jgi:hypothetical protein
MDILKEAQIKRSELLTVISSLSGYYEERAGVFQKRASRLKWSALACAIIGILMLGTFIVEGNGSMRWLCFGMVSVAFTGVAAVIITLFEKRHECARDCYDRIGELIQLEEFLRGDALTFDSAPARKRWYTARISILKSEHYNSRMTLGGLEFEELSAPPDVRSDKLLDTIADIGAAIALGAISEKLGESVADDISDVVSVLAV